MTWWMNPLGERVHLPCGRAGGIVVDGLRHRVTCLRCGASDAVPRCFCVRVEGCVHGCRQVGR